MSAKQADNKSEEKQRKCGDMEGCKARKETVVEGEVETCVLQRKLGV